VVSNYRFPPDARLKKKKDFENVYKNGSRVLKNCIVVLYYPNSSNISRLGVVASRKIGKAVVRNRFKRQVREIFRLNRNKLYDGVDIIIIARRVDEPCSFEVLQNESLEAFAIISNNH
jgi:ribonuclease P protein component